MSEYRRAVWRRACAETAKALSFTWGFAFRTTLVSAVGIGLTWLVLGRESGVNTAATILLGIVLSNIAVFGGLLVIKRLAAPALIYDDQQRNLNDALHQLTIAKAQLDIKRRNKAFADALQEHRERAIHTLWAVPQPLNQYEAPKWLDRLAKWEVDLDQIISAHSDDPDDKRHIGVLGNLFRSGEPPMYHPDPEMNHQLVMLDIRLQRIHDVIKKYDPDAL